MASTSSANEPSTSSTEELKPSNNWKETALHALTEWDSISERILYESMIGCKPFGINKHLNMLLIREKVSEELKLNIASDCIWDFLKTKWDIELADENEGVCFDITESDFTLPEEYNSLIAEEKEKLRGLEGFFDPTDTKDSLSELKKPQSKSSSMTSVDSKSGPNDAVPLTISENADVIKEEKVEVEEIPSTRRSLRTIDKVIEKELEDDSTNKRKILRGNTKSEEVNKSKDLKLINKKMLNKPKGLVKTENISNIRGRKRKNCNVFKSSVISENSKPIRNSRLNSTEQTLSDSASRSLTPEISSRKSNLRSSDKDQKLKLSNEKNNLKFGHNNQTSSEVKSERLRPEKVEKQNSASTEIKSNNSTPNKNDGNNKTKVKTRGRVTSDLLVVQQSPDVQPLGRRSCINKNS